MRIAIDTGGTFTDCIFLRDGKLQIVKVPSQPENPVGAIAAALREVRALDSCVDKDLDLVCGTTVGTNALLERRGGRVLLITTAGFEDVLEIGRQARPKLYDLQFQKPPVLVARNLRIGARERLAADGSVVTALSASEIGLLMRRVRRAQPEAVAICFLFSFRNPAHEAKLARALRRAGMLVSVSHEIFPEFREFERTSTTVINAYLAPVMSAYLTATEARAGKVLGAGYAASLAGIKKAITFDMGGTSTDVSLLTGDTQITTESFVAGLPISVPMLEIHTVGAGGGSVARFDAGGALRVGPESAGADPGPICYGRGDRPTVTDANLLLGRLQPDRFIGGEFMLDLGRTREITCERLQ